MVVALVIVGTVRNGCFVGSRLCRDGGVALLMRWGSITAGRWVHGLVGLCRTCRGGRGVKHNQSRVYQSVESFQLMQIFKCKLMWQQSSQL